MPRKSDSRQRMLGAAVNLIQRQGYHATGMKQVVEESGTPRGSLYFHFPDGKDQMVGEALGIAQTAVAGTIDRVAARSQTPAELIEGLGAAMAKWLTRSDFVEGCPVATVALEAGYCDQSHMTRVFRGQTGTTPAAYRRAHRQRQAARVPETLASS